VDDAAHVIDGARFSRRTAAADRPRRRSRNWQPTRRATTGDIIIPDDAIDVVGIGKVALRSRHFSNIVRVVGRQAPIESMRLIEKILMPVGSGAMRTGACREDPAFVQDATAATRAGKRAAMHRFGLPEIETAG
jgi:hypothetical protein